MLTVSIVLYKTDTQQLNTVLDCAVASDCVDRIYLIDNSPTDELKSYAGYSSNIDYIFNNANLGYGSAHNIAIRKSIEQGSDYHLVLNSDIRFEKDVLKKCLEYLDKNPDVGYLLPKVTYPNGEIQYLCKLLPTPVDLIFRRFIPSGGPFKKLKQKVNDRYALKASGYDKIMNPPCLSGCFMLLRTSTLVQNNILFDDNFFMYCEDFDLIRRIHRVAKTVFYPEVSIIHDHAQESYKNKKMLRQHIKSAVLYFNKYGWVFDRERKEVNEKIMEELKLVKTNGGGGYNCRLVFARFDTCYDSSFEAAA